MSYKSRTHYVAEGCLGCLDNGSRRCKNCLGRPIDKRKVGENKMACSKKPMKKVAKKSVKK